MLLGVNIDHVATVRQARKGMNPSPLDAAFCVAKSGGDSITLHLREDQRHIQEQDFLVIQKMVDLPVNLEMAPTQKMLDFALKHPPDYCCLVPEKREELTTESGLDVVSNATVLEPIIQQLKNYHIRVSLFIDPEESQIHAALDVGADAVEIHTGYYANHLNNEYYYEKIISTINLANNLGLNVHAGHGLNYHNVRKIAAIPFITELNIGHAIIARSIFCGLELAVCKMKEIINSACSQ